MQISDGEIVKKSIPFFHKRSKEVKVKAPLTNEPKEVSPIPFMVPKSFQKRRISQPHITTDAKALNMSEVGFRN